MNTQLKEGDRVCIIAGGYNSPTIGATGIIERIDVGSSVPYFIKFDRGTNYYSESWQRAEQVALISPTTNKPKQTITMKLTNAFTKFLSADLQAQVKAGFRDESLNLAPAGKDALLEIVATSPAGTDYAAEFTKAAQDAVAEQEKAA